MIADPPITSCPLKIVVAPSSGCQPRAYATPHIAETEGILTRLEPSHHDNCRRSRQVYKLNPQRPGHGVDLAQVLKLLATEALDMPLLLLGVPLLDYMG